MKIEFVTKHSGGPWTTTDEIHYLDGLGGHRLGLGPGRPRKMPERPQRLPEQVKGGRPTRRELLTKYRDTMHLRQSWDAVSRCEVEVYLAQELG